MWRILPYAVILLAFLSPSEVSKESSNPRFYIKPSCYRHIRTVVKESVRYDLYDTAGMFMGQIEQESRCDEKVTSYDQGKGLAQFMDSTAKWIHEEFKNDLSVISPNPNPYNPKWAIRAMILYDKWLYDRVKCKNDWHFTLRAYNGGLGNINKEIEKANSCDYEIVADFCLRSRYSCKINIEYPYLVFSRSLKYDEYIFGGSENFIILK